MNACIASPTRPLGCTPIATEEIALATRQKSLQLMLAALQGPFSALFGDCMCATIDRRAGANKRPHPLRMQVSVDCTHQLL